ncbi:hypothetical protein LCGC14_0223850 [marine sediment metagenome]|uniref:Uncharacterized protein n=1 Tax=marine sediment metagenome TaxID=412755 RepID=A0A0F9UTL1_9ZZZZ
MRFLKLKLIWNIIRGRAVISNNVFKGGFTLISEKCIISNNKFL